MGIKLNAVVEQFPIKGVFVISRERRTVQTVVRVTLEEGALRAQAECVPYKHYNETPEGVIESILSQREALGKGLTRVELQNRLPAGAARNALDCLLWDFEAKKTGKPVWQLAGLPAPKGVITARTISLGTPDEMHKNASALHGWPLIKIKLGGAGDDERLRAVRAALPDAKLIADANEAWTEELYESLVQVCVQNKISLIEQPFPAGQDGALAHLPRPVPVCADESLHDRHQLASLRGRYDAINIKLDKAGGLTEALALQKAAREQGFLILVGCMLATSLGMAPALLLAQDADFVDLDGPLLLEKDRKNGLHYDGARVGPPLSALWG
jgi:L-alanine-DL-glutamate epimerase-like enolase superfamily enzyme